MNHERENEIIRQIKDGNYLLFEEIVAAYQERLMLFIFRVVKDRDDAGDLCQDTLFKAYTSIKSFKGKSGFSTWLFQIGYRLSLNFIKKHKRRVEMDEKILQANPHPNPTGSRTGDMETDELNALVETLMLELPQKYRAALHLFFKEEKTYGEIGGIMKIPLNSVKSLIFRGKGLIKQRLAEDHRLILNT
jgi:RNA polymerase sigma-70 factor (ECF subfamily)